MIPTRPTGRQISLISNIMDNRTTQLASAPYNITIADTIEQLHPLARQWNELDRRSGLRLPRRSFEWVRAHIEHRLRSDESWFCVVMKAGDQLVGVLPVNYRKKKVLRTTQLVAYTPWDFHTKSVDLIASPQDHDQLLIAALEAVFAHLPGLFCFQFQRIPQDSPTLKQAAEIPGFRSVMQFDENGSVFDVSMDSQQFWATLGPNMRRNLTKWRKRMMRDGTTESVEWVSAGRGTDALEVFMQLEASGWKARTGTPIVNSGSQVAFFRQIDSNLRDCDELEWWFLTVEGKPIAGAMVRRFDDALAVIKVAYDETFARSGPGNLLFEDILARALEDSSIQTVDVLSDMAWHDRWKADKRQFFHLWLYPRSYTATVIGWLPRIIYRWAIQSPLTRGLVHRIKEIAK